MFTIDLSSFRDAVISAAGAVLLSALLVGAAVVPAQTAVAHTLGL